MLQVLQTWTREEIETALSRPDGANLRKNIGIWIRELLPPARLVPEAYREWRPLVGDSIAFVFSQLSAARLAAKITDQLRLPLDAPPEVRLIHAIGKMPGLQKLGQVLARNRHIDPGLRQELTTLENSIRDVEFGQVLEIIERELGPALDRHAVEIEPRIFSEASVSSVVRFSHRGGRGIFKVLKPHIKDCFGEDMALLQDLADFVISGEHGYGFAEPRLGETFIEIRRLLEKEVDFRREQASMAEARSVFGSLPGIRIPRIIPPFCTAVITAMSEETAVKITDFSGPREARHLIAEQLVEALLLHPLFSPAEQALFHADPHAGNLLYDERRRQIIVLDWALTAHLNRRQRRLFSMLILMLGLRDSAGAKSVIAQLGEVRASTEDIVREFIEQMPLTRMPGIMDAISLLDALALKGVAFPAELLLFRKVFFTLDGVLRDVAGGEIRLDEIISKYLGGHWLGAGQFPISLDAADWASILTSLFFYSTRLWLSQISRIGGNKSSPQKG